MYFDLHSSGWCLVHCVSPILASHSILHMQMRELMGGLGEAERGLPLHIGIDARGDGDAFVTRSFGGWDASGSFRIAVSEVRLQLAL